MRLICKKFTDSRAGGAFNYDGRVRHGPRADNIGAPHRQPRKYAMAAFACKAMAALASDLHTAVVTV